MIEVLKQMVEALEWCHGGEPVGTAEAIQAGKKLIAELESQEPVSALWQHGETGRFRVTTPDSITDCDARWFKVGDLYLRPPQRTEREPDVVMHWHSHTWTTINPPPKNSGDVNLYYAPPQRTESEPVAWQNMAFARLGVVRDKMHPNDVATVQRFLDGDYTHPLQRTEQEPVAYQDTAKPDELVAAEDWENIDPMYQSFYRPLYTTPPQRTWVGLTKEQLATTDWSADFRAGALWAESKLKERNT